MFNHIKELQSALEKCGYKTQIDIFKPIWMPNLRNKPVEIISLSLKENNDIEFIFDAKTGKRISPF